jgi:hypothetical protein
VVRPQRGGNQQSEFIETGGAQQRKQHAGEHVDQEAIEQGITDLLEHWDTLIRISPPPNRSKII